MRIKCRANEPWRWMKGSLDGRRRYRLAPDKDVFVEVQRALVSVAGNLHQGAADSVATQSNLVLTNRERRNTEERVFISRQACPSFG